MLTLRRPLPVFLHKNAEKKKALLKSRAENAKGADPPVACQVLKNPSAEAVKAFEERRAAGRGRGRGARFARKPQAAAVEEAGKEAVGGGAATSTFIAG